MKAIVLRKYGGPEVLRPEETYDPVPGRDEVLVTLEYAGINYADILSRKGLYGWSDKLPYIPGMEGTGVITDTGPGVDKSYIGKKVIAGSKNGMYAEKAVVPVDRTIPVIDKYSAAENAAFLVNYMTSWVALFKMAKVQPGEKVLVTAAAGGVGTAAVQLASGFGCDVYGMAGSETKTEIIKSCGAIEGFNYRSNNAFRDLGDLTGGVDVVIELVGGEIYRKSMELLNPFGRIVVTGFASLDLKKWNPLSWIRTWMDIPRANIREMANSSVGVMATHLGYLLENNPAILKQIYDEIYEFIIKQEIHPVIGAVFPFEQVSEAHKLIESRESSGKILLRL